MYVWAPQPPQKTITVGPTHPSLDQCYLNCVTHPPIHLTPHRRNTSSRVGVCMTYMYGYLPFSPGGLFMNDPSFSIPGSLGGQLFLDFFPSVSGNFFSRAVPPQVI